MSQIKSLDQSARLKRFMKKGPGMLLYLLLLELMVARRFYRICTYTDLLHNSFSNDIVYYYNLLQRQYLPMGKLVVVRRLL